MNVNERSIAKYGHAAHQSNHISDSHLAPETRTKKQWLYLLLKIFTLIHLFQSRSVYCWIDALEIQPASQGSLFYSLRAARGDVKSIFGTLDPCSGICVFFWKRQFKYINVVCSIPVQFQYNCQVSNARSLMISQLLVHLSPKTINVCERYRCKLSKQCADV